MFLSWGAFTIALFCKETAALLPFLFIIYYFTFPFEKHFDKKYLLNIMLYAISGIFWFWLYYKAVGGGILKYKDSSVFKLILSNIRTIPESLLKFFFPFDNNPIPIYSIFKTLAGIGLIGVIIFIFFKNKERSKKEKIFCFSWFFFLMLPPMLSTPLNIDYLDHRFLLPLIGILLFMLFIIPKKWFEKGALKRYWLMIVIIVILSSFTLIKSRSYSDPMTFYNTVVSFNSNSAPAYNNRGIIKKDRGDVQGAIEDYNKAIVINPNYSEAYYNRGNAKSYTDDNLGVIEDMDKAIAINPNYVEAYNNRGVAKKKLGDNLGAIADYNNIIRINPNNAEIYSNIGVAMGSINKFQEAIINLNKAIEINPNYIDAYFNRAITKYKLGDLAGAIVDCDNALKLNPNYENALNLKAKAQQGLQK